MLIQNIEELFTSCLNNAEGKLQYCMNLLQMIQRPIATEELKLIEGQLNVSLSLNMPTQNFKDLLNFYNSQFFQEYKTCNQRLEEIKSMTVENIKKVLAQEFSLFLEAHIESVCCVAVTSDNEYIIVYI